MMCKLYKLKAANGKHIRMATKVTLSDGNVFHFMERLSNKEAKRQVKEKLNKNLR